MKTFKPMLLAAAVALGASQAGALPLVAGDTIVMTGTTSAAQPELGGGVLNDNLIPFDFVGDGLFYVGYSLQNRVVESGETGNLIFGPRLRDPINTLSSAIGILYIDGFSISGYGDFAVDAAYRTDGLGDVGPTSASRSADGDTLTFDFGFPMTSHYLAEEVHDTSYFLSLATDATAFDTSGIMTIFAHGSVNPTEQFQIRIEGVAVPVAPAVPLPAPALLLLGALGGFAGLKRRRAKG